jgi:laccase
MVTQCPIKPGATYTYRFNATGQEGTLWWHAHISLLRATVYGALILRPRGGAAAYPFSKPYGEETVLLGEWWNDNVHELDDNAFLNGETVRNADAYTINGKPGDMYNCSDANGTHSFQVVRNQTYLLRIINAALNTPMFFKVANHSFTVVGADAAYTTPYETDVVVVAPGQTVDALMVTGAAVGRYYMAASPYDSVVPGGLPFSMTTATAVVEYAGSDAEAPPQLPSRPEYNDTDTAFRFLSNLTALVLPGKPTVPLSVDTHMFVTVGLGNTDCLPKQVLCNTTGDRDPIFAASMNNASFLLPDPAESVSMLQAHYENASAGVYTRDFPDLPPVIFDYTASDNATLKYTTKSTKVRTLRYNETVEMVLQNTRLIAKESHPMHLHGFNFFVLAQGFGNYDEAAAKPQFNLVNPQERNTVAVPTGGWAVIRFVANNPGRCLHQDYFSNLLIACDHSTCMEN